MKIAAALAFASLSVGCADLMPETTRVVANTPFAPSPADATVVLARPSPSGSAGPADRLPVDERWSFVRVVDGDRHVLVDLRVNEHAVLSFAPGTRELFAYAWWDDARHAECVGAMRADLSAGHVYPVLVRGLEHVGGRRHGCTHLELMEALADERSWFWRWTRESSARVELRADRERSIFLDAPWMTTAHVEVGRERLSGREAPVHPAAFVSSSDGE